jgi:hypothetical protein
MRIYYAVEAEGLHRHVRSALGVDAGAWNRFNRRIHEWRRSLESRYGIPADLGLRADELASVPQSCACGCHSQPAHRHGAEVIAEGLRLIEDFAVESGGLGVTNICLDKDDIPAYRRVSLDRLFNRVNATAARAGGHALVIFGQEPEEMVASLYHRLRNYNPVPTRHGACDDSVYGEVAGVPAVIAGPAFRDPDGDSGALAGAFGVLDRALNRRAARHDPRGVVRR